MDIIRLEIRSSSERALLSVTIAASVFFWGWTWWRSRNDAWEEGAVRPNNNVYQIVHSPGSPRTRGAFKRRGCSCKKIDTKDDCLQNKKKNKWTGSDEEETDTDANLIPSSMRSSRHVMLNR